MTFVVLRPFVDYGMNKTIQISDRFCGPPNSGNGGYVCGMLDNQTDFVSQVTLRKPPPLEAPMELHREDTVYKLFEEEELVAEAKAGSLEFSAPSPPTFAIAKQSAKKFIAAEDRHFFPTCFVCGPDRPAHDGLEIFAGGVDGEDFVASPWIPDASLNDGSGQVAHEFMWAALDCPGAFAIMEEGVKKLVLGRLTVEVKKRVDIGEECVVLGWGKGSEGRKHYSGTAIYNSKQELCAVGDAVWIEIE